MFEDTFKNRIRLGCSITASLFFLNALLATSQIIFYLALVEGVFALLFSIRLPTPLPPPPSPDMWKNIKTFWTYTLTPKSRWIILIIFAIIIFIL